VPYTTPAFAVSNPRPLGSDGRRHEEDQDGAHPVVAEALPELGEEQRRKSSGIARRIGCRTPRGWERQLVGRQSWPSRGSSGSMFLQDVFQDHAIDPSIHADPHVVVLPIHEIRNASRNSRVGRP
jgi:hypothetical protein